MYHIKSYHVYTCTTKSVTRYLVTQWSWAFTFKFLRYIHVNNYPVEVFYINRCYTDTYMYTVDFNPPCLCYVGSNDNLTNSCRRSLKDVSLVHSGHQGVERNYAQISSCDKKNWSMYMYIHLAKIRYNCDRINDSITLKH